ncbi:MAG TPA: hypothetical protein VGK48_04830 [Terriglobia bacterium]|jgi:HSP20 family molecular chaperone IbpA
MRLETFSPQIDIFERNGKLVLRADMPGMTTANFKNGVLEVTVDAPQQYKNRRKIEIKGESSTTTTTGKSGQEAA